MSAHESTRLLTTLQNLLDIPIAELKSALNHSANVIAEALGADKVDAFLYDESRDSLAVVGISSQPLSNLQKRLGLDVLPLSNGGRVVYVYKTGEVFRTGNLLDDSEELRGIKEGLKIRSKIGIPLDVGGQRRGMIMIASLKPDYFTASDEAFARSVVRWVGSVAHRAELIQDIEREAVEQGRRAAADELVTVLAHDLRNYIAPISYRLYALRHSAETDQRTEDLDHVQGALRGLARLNTVVSDLLDAARIDKGLFDLALAPIDLAVLANEAAAALSTGEQRVRVSATGSIVVMGDVARLRQCLDNMLANAIAHSPKGATVSLFVSDLQKEGDEWGQIEIIDEGPGIPEELLPRIFDRFVSGSGTKSGMGLGLYLAKRIVVAHGGEILVDQNLGKGAKFIVRLRRYTEGGLGGGSSVDRTTEAAQV